MVREKQIVGRLLKEKPTVKSRSFAVHFTLAIASLLLAQLPVFAMELGLPAACTPGKDCFVQQYPDMDPGPQAIDPFCGTATYDGHSGTDLRILSMKDVARGVPVLAMADGTVLRTRDGEPDRLVSTADDREKVASKECGNGIVISHGGGFETQYCHLKQGSVSVSAGDDVREGDRIGEIGASGLAQFPHVHVAVRRDGVDLDPSTGSPLDSGCGGAASSRTLFSPEMQDLLGRGETQILALGMAGAIVRHSDLVLSGPPPPPDSSSPALVGWAWLQNLRKGDAIAIEVMGPDGEAFATGTTEYMDRPKATYSAYAGRRGAPSPGNYEMTVRLLRDGEAVVARTARYTVE